MKTQQNAKKLWFNYSGYIITCCSSFTQSLHGGSITFAQINKSFIKMVVSLHLIPTYNNVESVS